MIDDQVAGLRKSARLMRIPVFMWGAVLWFWHPERKKILQCRKADRWIWIINYKVRSQAQRRTIAK